MTEPLSVLPAHIGFIMDGNGRWAQKRGLPRKIGHEAGARTLEVMIDRCRALGLRCATFYAFSTENWSRPEDEINAIMNLLDRYITDLKRKILRGEVDAFKKMQLRFVGDLSVFSDERREKMAELEELTTKPFTQARINLAINYGGKDEITSSVNRFISENPGKEITQSDISRGLFTDGCPDVDLIIRTAGEMRLSNFLLWQAAYAEFYATPVFWPDFDAKELDKALAAYSERTRKFGNIK